MSKRRKRDEAKLISASISMGFFIGIIAVIHNYYTKNEVVIEREWKD